MATITLMNNDLRIFQGLYESTLYNSDTDYYLARILADDNADGIDLKNTEVDYDFNEFKQVAGKACVNSLEDELYSHDVITNMDYAGMSSPRFYNYDTDRVLIDIDYNFIALVKYCKHTNRDKFNQYLKDNYTSYDGYISFVENSVDSFFSKDWFDSHKNMAVQVMIEFYLTSEIDLDAHLQNMYEACQEWLMCHAELKQAESV